MIVAASAMALTHAVCHELDTIVTANTLVLTNGVCYSAQVHTGLSDHPRVRIPGMRSS